MSSAQQLLRDKRSTLLEWTCSNPAPLLRWLHDAEVLSSAQYFSLLEKSPSNAVAQALEIVCASEESSQKFLQVLVEVQDYYCEHLQAWVDKHCKNDTAPKPAPTPIKVEQKKSKSLFPKFKFKERSARFTVTDGVEAQEELKPSRSKKLATIRGPISAHKTTLLKRTEQLKHSAEGEGMTLNVASHIEIRYTDLFVTEDEDLVDNSQHEYFSLASRRARIYVHQACRRIRPCHLMDPQRPSGRCPKRVKVKGIAGIGKSVAVQRLLYEWAIGKSMQEFTCIFDLRFRELNLISDPVSLVELLEERFRYLKEVLPNLFTTPSTLLFILDGLDEFKFPLDWNAPDKVINIDSKVPVSDLMVALIKGSLLPEASVILTTRPSTEAPRHFFQRCCVVLGFEEEQVKQYATKFYKDSTIAEKVSDYIFNNDNLFVLSFIPLYCYIICTAMAEFFTPENQVVDVQNCLELNPPKTVSEVYFYYLLTAVKHHGLKANAERRTSRAEVLSSARKELTNLGRLAYESLLQKKIMFNRADLESCSVAPAEVESTFLCNFLQPIKEETVEMFSFFHLTVQEHLAALYCAINVFNQEDIIQALDFWCFGQHPSSSQAAPLQNIDLNMDKLESLQMFTRFFMGMLRAQLDGQLEGLVTSPMEAKDLVPGRLGLWFQEQFKGRELKNQTALNLLHCMMEFHMKETTIMVAPEIKKLNLFKMKLTVVDCAAMHYVLQFSPHKLQELNLGYSNIGNRGLDRLGPILHRCESLYLRYNCLDKQAAILESAVLQSNECQVKKLFMCGNNLGAEGVLELWKALEHNNTVEELYLDITGITEQGTDNIVNSLSKNTSLKTLTIVGNDLGEVGKQRLRDLNKCRPELQIIANFVDDLGLLQAYVDWVEEMEKDKDQMDSVKNADALQSVLKGLQGAGEQVERGENAEKAQELQMKIEKLLATSTYLTEGR